MKKYALLRYCLVFLAIVLPYFSAATINGPERVLAERVPDMEEYLPVIVFSQIFPDMKKETIKAQTVIARSNIQRWLGEGREKILRRSSGKTKMQEKSGDIFLQKKGRSMNRQQKRRMDRYLHMKEK